MGKRLLKGKNCLKNSKEKGGESILLGKERKCIASLEVWEIHYAELQTMFASSSLLRCVHGGFLVFFSLFLSFSLSLFLSFSLSLAKLFSFLGPMVICGS